MKNFQQTPKQRRIVMAGNKNQLAQSRKHKPAPPTDHNSIDQEKRVMPNGEPWDRLNNWQPYPRWPGFHGYW